MVSLEPPQMLMSPIRGVVQRTFRETKVLAGFMDTGHFDLFSQEYLTTLTDEQNKKLHADHAAARAKVGGLVPVDFSDVVGPAIANPHVEKIKALPAFAQNFSQRPYQFHWVDPRRLVALQVHVKPRADVVPAQEDALMEFCLPDRVDVPAELSFIAPAGPINIVSSSPSMAGVNIRLEGKEGRVIIEPPQHLNLVQVTHFQGRYYLRNGYHRVYDAIQAGVPRIPAVVTQAVQPNDVGLQPGNGSFNVPYVAGLARPPLMMDFVSDLSMEVKLRERRYGVSVGLQITAINIPI